MKNIGILTFYRSENFGANLQALSTYRYFENAGYTPWMVYYASEAYCENQRRRRDVSPQLTAHLDFVDRMMPRQTAVCHTADEINRQLRDHGIDCMVMGSDAIVQHHPLLSRIHRGNRKPVYIERPTPERMFPNLFWGVGINPEVRLAYMSVSSQNSAYRLFSRRLKKEMARALGRFGYISLRDGWTRAMFESVTGKSYPCTPDPVFAFNHNAASLLAPKEQTIARFGLPERYVLVSLMGQTVTRDDLSRLASEFDKHGLECVALPMPTGHGFDHGFPHAIPEPLDPADWYNLIRHSSGYVGSNMHPVIVALHNAVPCYSIDFWGARDFWNRPRRDGSSKVEDILSRFGLSANHSFISGKTCAIEPREIVDRIVNFPREAVKAKAAEMQTLYLAMMADIEKSLS